MSGPSALDADFGISDLELATAERIICDAMATRSTAALNVLGFGENGVAIAYPADAPQAVLKRTMGCNNESAADLRLNQIEAYVRAVEPHVAVAPTQLRKLRNDAGQFVPYMVQELYPKEQLVETILADTEPAPNHPIVLALREAVLAVSQDGTLALDAQFANFAWVDDALVYFDIGLPFVYEDGEYAGEVGEELRVMPAPLRPLAEKKVRQMLAEMAGVRGSFVQAAMGLPRMGLDHWLEPVVQSFNHVLDDPLDAEAMRARMNDLDKQTTVLKNFMKLQRAWSTKVRRQPYDSFITDSFTGELL